MEQKNKYTVPIFPKNNKKKSGRTLGKDDSILTKAPNRIRKSIANDSNISYTADEPMLVENDHHQAIKDLPSIDDSGISADFADERDRLNLTCDRNRAENLSNENTNISMDYNYGSPAKDDIAFEDTTQEYDDSISDSNNTMEHSIQEGFVDKAKKIYKRRSTSACSSTSSKSEYLTPPNSIHTEEVTGDNTANNDFNLANDSNSEDEECRENIFSNPSINHSLLSSKFKQILNMFLDQFYRKLEKYVKILIREGNMTDNKISISELFNTLFQCVRKCNPERSINLADNLMLKFYSRRKASKIIDTSKKLIPNNLEHDQLAIFFAAIAIDICRCRQQQISIIKDSKCYYYMKTFVRDIVESIFRYLHKRQGRFGLISRLKDAISRKKETDYAAQAKLLIDLEHDADNPETFKKSLEYFMEGFFCHNPNVKKIRKWVHGHVVDICLPVKKNHRNVNTINLLHRVYVKDNENGAYYFPSSKDSSVRRIVGKILGRLIDYHQDETTKLCGYRLPSLIFSNEITRGQGSYSKVDPPAFETQDCFQLDETLCRIDSIDKILDFAKKFVRNDMDRNLRDRYNDLFNFTI
ncbi:uncharacterized protein TRIADDRAFT_59631 [Trichoplax adhaerens]|uniref:Uncharacterized protein n=1 Tax=Trichoplax adhaerens TaxID=10228 RepID=B3S5I8_TRIAD|nr:hypothetical protein TRIADDRAFT_59631 [Trichoplax adhaerens]EDV22047.1 hypothetical protein TRIADDRAFT_59631 [Trichoplax adhaerens]|eukprot:XP_002115684.1 hypothetical protein TRIADDRAFT_59631 [Trichoplax adhaerens]